MNSPGEAAEHNLKSADNNRVITPVLRRRFQDAPINNIYLSLSLQGHTLNTPETLLLDYWFMARAPTPGQKEF